MERDEGFDPQLHTLFKYRSLSGEFGREAAIDILTRDRMFWQSPDGFNDPFDCAPTFVFGKSSLSREAYARRAIGRHMPNASRYDRRNKKREIIGRGPKRNAEIIQETFQQLMRESAISCFSLVPDSLLMWAHYADSHRGICFQFQEQVKPTPFIAFEVSYQEARPSLDGTAAANIGSFKKGVLTKAKMWEYEQERRMLGYRAPPGHRAFPAETLTGIIFGARISSDDRSFIDGLLCQREFPLPRFQAELSGDSFALDIIPLS